MPSFQRLLVLSVLALSLSVQSAPVGTVETRDIGHVSRSTEPDVVPFDDVEAREFDEDEENSLEARAKKHHKAHHKSTKGKGHKGHKGTGSIQDEGHKGHKGKGGFQDAHGTVPYAKLAKEGLDVHHNVEAREFDEDEENSLEARAKKHHKAHHKSTKSKGHKTTGKGRGILDDLGAHGNVETREFDEDEEDSLEARAKKHHHAHHKSTKGKGHKGGSLSFGNSLDGTPFDGEGGLKFQVREFDEEEEEETLEARAKTHHKAHHKSTKGKGHKGHKGTGSIQDEGRKGHKGKGGFQDAHGTVPYAKLAKEGLDVHHNVEAREFDDDEDDSFEAREFDEEEDTLAARAKKHHKAHHKSTKGKGHKGHKGKGDLSRGGPRGGAGPGLDGHGHFEVGARDVDDDDEVSLEARSSKHHHAQPKPVKGHGREDQIRKGKSHKGKGHKGKGKGHKGKGGKLGGGDLLGHPIVVEREFSLADIDE